ncbi:hypothetical protein GCM10009863_63260 [Streptomyces axinellae]|uniref:Uncharacterized protein n=1 Tax=Streptomyces axinellae TaxID=552788 RepID=A0ABP6D7L6_9ACTN
MAAIPACPIMASLNLMLRQFGRLAGIPVRAGEFSLLEGSPPALVEYRARGAPAFVHFPRRAQVRVPYPA